LSYIARASVRYSCTMHRPSAPVSPAVLFDVTLTAIVIVFGLLFDHVVQVPLQQSPQHYAQHSAAP